MSIRGVRELARRQLHDHMGEPANYYALPRAPTPTFTLITARPHSNVAKAGDLAGTNLSYAETQDRAESIVFMLDEVPDPVRNALVIFTITEGYFLNNVLPPNGITVTAEVIRADHRDLVGLTAPDGTVIS